MLVLTELRTHVVPDIAPPISAEELLWMDTFPPKYPSQSPSSLSPPRWARILGNQLSSPAGVSLISGPSPLLPEDCPCVSFCKLIPLILRIGLSKVGAP